MGASFSFVSFSLRKFTARSTHSGKKGEFIFVLFLSFHAKRLTLIIFCWFKWKELFRFQSKCPSIRNEELDEPLRYISLFAFLKWIFIKLMSTKHTIDSSTVDGDGIFFSMCFVNVKSSQEREKKIGGRNVIHNERIQWRDEEWKLGWDGWCEKYCWEMFFVWCLK